MGTLGDIHFTYTTWPGLLVAPMDQIRPLAASTLRVLPREGFTSGKCGRVTGTEDGEGGREWLAILLGVMGE
jgi:hypothetical protein